MSGAMIPSDWDGETWKCYSVEWPNSEEWYAILYGFITTPKQGRFWDGQTGSIVAVQETGNEIWDRNYPDLEESLMSCSEDFLALLASQNNLLAEMVQALNRQADCCSTGGAATGGLGGSRGTGTVDVSPINYDESNNPDTPPPGFDSWSEYRSHKCNMATQIVRELARDLLNASLIELASVGISALSGILVVTFVSPIPFDGLLTIATAIIVGGIIGSYLATISEDITSVETNLVCQLYTAETASEAETKLEAALADIIENSGIGSTFWPYLKQMVNAMITIASMNRLFVNVPTSETGDCTSCEPAYWWSCSVGELLDYDTDQVELGAVEDAYGGYILILGMDTATDFTTSLQNGSITTHPDSPQCATTQFVTNVGCNVTCYQSYNAQYPVPGSFGTFDDTYTLMYRSGAPFSVLFER